MEPSSTRRRSEFDQEAFLRDARAAAVAKGDLDERQSTGRLHKLRGGGGSLKFEPAAGSAKPPAPAYGGGGAIGLSSRFSSGLGYGSDDEEDISAVAFGGSQLLSRPSTAQTIDAELARGTVAEPPVGGIRYRGSDPRARGPGVAAAAPAVTVAAPPTAAPPAAAAAVAAQDLVAWALSQGSFSEGSSRKEKKSKKEKRSKKEKKEKNKRKREKKDHHKKKKKRRRERSSSSSSSDSDS